MKTKKPKDKIVATLTIHGLGDMKIKQARRLLSWLKDYSYSFYDQENRSKYSKRFTARLYEVGE